MDIIASKEAKKACRHKVESEQSGRNSFLSEKAYKDCLDTIQPEIDRAKAVSSEYDKIWLNAKASKNLKNQYLAERSKFEAKVKRFDKEDCFDKARQLESYQLEDEKHEHREPQGRSSPQQVYTGPIVFSIEACEKSRKWDKIDLDNEADKYSDFESWLRYRLSDEIDKTGFWELPEYIRRAL
jgi:hypothetical protein